MPTNAELRKFIVERFSDNDFDLLVADYFGSYKSSEPSGLALSARAQRLIDYCTRTLGRQELEHALKAERPDHYRGTFASVNQESTSGNPPKSSGTATFRPSTFPSAGEGLPFSGEINIGGDVVIGNKIIGNQYQVVGTESKIRSIANDRVRILICTATDKEDEALAEIVKLKGYAYESLPLVKGTYRSLGIIGRSDVFASRSGMGASGPAGSLATTLDAIDELGPDFIIACGLAFGIDPLRQNLGDVLVSEWVQAYEKGRVRPGEFISRGAKVPADPLLLQAARSARQEVQGITVLMGGLLSGEKLVDDPSFKAELIKREPEAIGGEMEASGLIDASYRRGVRWLVVKAICDWGENKKNDAQTIAAANAMRFVFAMIEGMLIPGDIRDSSRKPK